ncbi:GMC oxidoreductase [Mycolicibacterium alvei]|uniref:Cholesterol oxidase n=1 Tax=Mycolicibacterium alvei TaxID=67081 RepID=A0A6N4V0E9_9MYCO|nr:GMC oxidoreductase [Mycolicibacterium alvei]MCV7000096.1 GMC family oxidoreductase [Mycolicibacterium alvei]BBX30098.1 hypothetical protein MALV_52230 [Mycolicibacterium alvei]
MPSAEHTWDAVVVGSGFGGSITAARLAQSGLRVLILERGGWWHNMPGTLPPPGSPGRRSKNALRMLRGVHWATPHVARTVTVAHGGLYELHQFDKISCLVASGVGGGSLVYTDMQVRPPDAYFAAYPPEITAAEMSPHFDSVKRMLGAAPIADRSPRREAFEKALAMADLGPPHHPDLALHSDAPTATDPKAFTRSTLDRNYLPLATGCGAELRALSEVTAIGPHEGGWQIRYRDHAARRTYVESTTRLVLAAGTLGTLRLLFAGRDRHRTLPRLGRALGSRFNPNGDMATLLAGTPKDRGTRTEPTVTALLHRTLAEHTAITGAFGLPLNQFELPKAAARAIDRGTILFSMGSGTMSAQVAFDGHRLHIPEGRADDAHIYHELENDVVRLARGYGAKRIFVNAPFGARSDRAFTVHPLGGASIGTSPADGVVDHTGAVFGHPGLFIADGSILPCAPGTPPSMTIAALAERQSSFIAGYQPTSRKEQ